jgi:hypothetical protein
LRIGNGDLPLVVEDTMVVCVGQWVPHFCQFANCNSCVPVFAAESHSLAADRDSFASSLLDRPSKGHREISAADVCAGRGAAPRDRPEPDILAPLSPL